MPTPLQYANQTSRIRPIDGTVDGLTWDSFIKSFSPVAAGDVGQYVPGQTLSGEGGGSTTPGYYLGSLGALQNTSATISGLGSVYASRNGQNFSGGEGGSAGGEVHYGSADWDQYGQDVGDGTRNTFTQELDAQGNPTGRVLSHNDTINNDSWWDSTGLPLVASLAFGGATAGLAAGGIGVSGAGAGAVNVGVGYGANSLEALGAGGGGAFGSTAGSALSNTADIGSQSYNPFNPANWTADAGTTATDAGVNAATQPSWLDSLGNTVKDGWNTASNAWGGINPLVRTGITSLAGEAFQGGGSDSTAQSLIDGTYDPTANFVNPSSSATQGAINTGETLNLNGSSGSTNPLSALLHGYNSLTGNGGTGFDTNDAWSLAGLGSSIYNGVAGSSAAKTAAGQQTDAINNANALTAKLYGDSVARNQPFLNAGTNALTQQTNLLGMNGADAQKSAFGQFQASPDYQWRLDQGMKGVQNSAAAAGGLYSGRAAKDLTNFGQNQASAEFGNYQNRLSNLVNVGQNSANLTGQLTQGYGNTAANLLTAGGMAQSAGTMAGSNAVTNALTQLLKLNSNNGYYGT